MSNIICTKTFNAQVYETIRQDIIDQKIEFGEILVNHKLQERFGVSSTPIRDAINHLYQEGLVEDISKSGARVITFDLKNALEINEIVSMLNVGAVRLAAAKPNAMDLAPVLKKYIALQRRFISSDEYFTYDNLFHEAFFDLSQNCRFKKLYSQYQTLRLLLVRLYYSNKDRTKPYSIDQHQKIVEAYQQKDIHLAQDLMERHFQDAIPALEKVLK
jgi:DNA-binding GntR family transcriptional regulator